MTTPALTTAQDIATALHGIEYPADIHADIQKAAKDNGIVIVFGASDDLMELRGAINDEFGCYDGGTAKLDANGLLPEWECVRDDGSRDEIAQWIERDKTAKAIEAVWAPDEPEGASWAYVTSIPHLTFDVMEDGQIYCRGMVFNLSYLDKPVVQHLPSDSSEGGEI